MNAFLKLFGINYKEIKEDVIITPFLNLEYFKTDSKSKSHKGLLFEVLSEKYFSVIRTKIGAPFVGDTVVYLKDTPCKRIYFIGSCGAVSNFHIDDLAVVDKVLAWESFSEMLGHSPSHSFMQAENSLSRSFLELNKKEVKKAKAATLGSLSLQEKILPSLKKLEIDVVDMETSSFISAAKYFKFPSLALLYVTDIVSSKPFFRDLGKEERDKISQSRQRAISLICNFIRKHNA